MQHIGDEMEASTGVINLKQQDPAILDLCAAPGGFVATALKYNPSATVCGISLPKSLGGHRLLVKFGRADRRVTVRYMDITLLGTEYGLDASQVALSNLSSERPYLGQAFDLVFCDGQVLRTHAQHRDTEREKFEARRLTCSQLILALQRIRDGGTLIMLLHKVEAWNTLVTLRTVSAFSKVQLFKPKKYHATRSSFYMVATDLKPGSPAARIAVEGWKAMWREATIGLPDTDSEDSFTALSKERVQEVNEMVEDFGAQLIQLAEPIWLVQKNALSGKSWTK